MTEELFLALFLAVVLASGIWCIIDPEAVVRFRSRMGWSTSYWSGGIAYATPRRARLTGSLLVTVVLLAVFLKWF